MKAYSRRLHVTVSGRWYLGLTIIIGVVAITTGNSSIYVIESLLLSGLILSGILSERVIISVDAEVRRGPAIALSHLSTGDQIVVKNLRNRHLFCLEVGEWGDGVFIPMAWIAQLRPHEVLTVKSKRVYPKRGLHQWTAIAIATRYPFGFARKIRFENPGGERIVWPAIAGESNPQSQREAWLKEKATAGTKHQHGEVRPMLLDDDYRSIVWTLSSKGSEPVVRTRKGKNQSIELLLDIRKKRGNEFEKLVSQAALTFFRSRNDQPCSLFIVDSHGKKVLHGKIPILNSLALIEPEAHS